MKICNKLNPLLWITFLLLTFFLHSCSDLQEKKPAKKPWNHKEVMHQKLKWFLNPNNYTDSNYLVRFQNTYQGFLDKQQNDSALYYLLTFAEMIDQNYLYDSTFLSMAKAHLKKFEPISTFDGELIKLYYYIGSQYEVISENKTAIAWFEKGINHPDVMTKTKIKCMGMLATIYDGSNQFEKALPLKLERIAFYTKEKDTINMGVAYASIAGTYGVLNAHQLAIENIEKAIGFARQKNDTNTLIPFICNLLIYKKNSRPELNITQDDKKIIFELNDICNSYSALSPYNNWVKLEQLFTLYLYENKLDSVEGVIKEMEELNEILNNKEFDNIILFMKSRLQNKRGTTIQNIKELQETAKLLEDNEMYWEAFRLYIILSANAEKKGDYKNALKFSNKINDIELRRIAQNNKGHIYEMEVKYQTQKKDQEIILQSEQLKIKQRNIGLLLAILIIIILSALLYFLWQKKKYLNQKNIQEIRFTQQLMESAEEERQRIAKDLHDSVGHELLSIRNAIANNYEFKEEKIDTILNEVREISRNLFPVMFEEVGLKISVEQMAENIYKGENLYINTQLNYQINTLPSKIELQIYRIIQEALNNTRKYAQAKSALVSIDQDLESVTVIIKDNGKGFDIQKALQSGKSFGLLSIEKRCKTMNATCHFHSNDKGTTIEIRIPISS